MRYVALAVMALSAAIAAQAYADDVASAPFKSARPAQTKAKPKSKSDGLSERRLSNPFAPPDAASKGKANGFLADPRPSPTAPNGDVSFTYKWRASNAPNDPYDHVRRLTPDGPGDAFMGGLKFGF